MALSLRPEHLGRYVDIARLLVRHGRGELARASLAGDLHPSANGSDPSTRTDADTLAEDLESLGPTYIKLGQILSTRSDLLPAAYLEALERLQDRVEPFPAEEAEAIVASELGGRLSKLFARFDPEPIAAASLGQVHFAEMRDGRAVAVKVQRPGIRERIATDLEALGELAAFLDRHAETAARLALTELLDEFRQSINRELDYRLEAANLERLGRALEDYPRLLVPHPLADYTTSRVLTMEYVSGVKITSLSPLARIELDGTDLATDLFRAYLDQVLVHGFFHADPHPGNVFVTRDHRLALIDLGMIGHVAPQMQEQLLKLLLAVSDGRGEDAAAIGATIGQRLDNYDPRAYTREVSRLVALIASQPIQNAAMGRAILQITRISTEHGVRQPPELSLLGKTLLHLDEVARTLAPDFDPNAEVRSHATSLLRQRMLRAASPANIFSTAIELTELVQRLPARLNRGLDRIADGNLRVRIDSIDESRLIGGLQKIANRITVGLILAALIVGAAMLMRVQTAFTILGYPGLAMLLFIAAAVGGILLVWDILKHDRAERSGP